MDLQTTQLIPTTEQTNKRNSLNFHLSEKSKSKLTQELLPSFTFGSQGVKLDNDKTSSRSEEKQAAESLYSDFDSMNNIFYENSVRNGKANWQIKFKPKQLPLQKQLEKKILKVKAKSIFKNYLVKKYAVNEEDSKQTEYSSFTSKDAFRKIKKKKKRSQPKKKDPHLNFDLNESLVPKRFDFLNTSLPLNNNLKKKSKPRKPVKLNFGSFLPKNDNIQTEKVNNMIHGLNNSKLPESFIDFNCLNSSISTPSFEEFAVDKPFSLRQNSLNFSFNPKLNSNMNTNYSLSSIEEDQKWDYTKPPETSIFEVNILSTNTIENDPDFSRNNDNNPKQSQNMFSPSGTLSINFRVLN